MAIPTLHDVLAAAIHDHDDAVDVSELRFVDGRAAAVIHGELSRRRDAGQRVRLVGANDLVRRMWGLCGFDQELPAG
jgi:anti-anti-sigma regulatory factor